MVTRLVKTWNPASPLFPPPLLLCVIQSHQLPHHPPTLLTPPPQGSALSISTLVQQLAEKDAAAACKAARVIAGMAYDAGPDKLADLFVAGVLSPLVALLGPENTAEVQGHAAMALANLIDGEDGQVKVAAAGAISPLVALLGTQSTAEVQEQAAGALRNIAGISSHTTCKVKGEILLYIYCLSYPN